MWITNNGWAGYDPYDIRGQDWFVAIFGYQSKVFRKIRGALSLVEARVPPYALRRALAVQKEVNPKGMGLIAKAYLILFQLTTSESYLEKSESVIRWLLSNSAESFPGRSWGYPFHWQSRIFIPRGTPSVVVTSTIGDALLDHYEITQSDESLTAALEIAEFFCKGLNRSVDDSRGLCFSYTPLDQYKVHNANLFAAAFLARLGQLTSNVGYTELALRSTQYTLSEQNPDGSFYYWGSESPTIIDHYHTGFVLRHLDTVRRASEASFIRSPVKIGYEFYLKHLFTASGLPKYTPTQLYPIDIHSCAEALLCLCQLGPEFGGTDKLAAVFELAQSRMQTADGWYVAALRRRFCRDVAVKIPYMRWGQAWMLLALAHLAATVARLNHNREAFRCE